jgi:hypothetical protein
MITWSMGCPVTLSLARNMGGIPGMRQSTMMVLLAALS